MSDPVDPNITYDGINKLLKHYDTAFAQLKTAVDNYSSQTRSFTSLSPELEASGTEARRVARSLLRQCEDSLSVSRKRYQQRKEELEQMLRRFDSKDKQELVNYKCI